MQKKNNMATLFPIIVIGICFIIAVGIYMFILGNPNNFVDELKEKPKTGNLLGLMYKGGQLVPLILTMMLMVIVFSIERILTVMKAKGSGNITNFVRKIQYNLTAGDLAAAEAECDRQKGSIANV